MLFVLALVGLPIQLAYAKYGTEPYPAVVLPGFGAAAHLGDYVTTKEFEVRVEFANGETADVEVTDLFGGVPGHRARGFLRNVAPATGEPKESPAVRRWMRANLAERYDRRPRGLVVEWRERRYRRSDWTEVDDSPLSTRRLVFDRRPGEQR